MRYATSLVAGTIFCLTCAVTVFTVFYARTLGEAQAESFDFAYIYLGILAVCSFGAAVSGLTEAGIYRQPVMTSKIKLYVFMALCFGYVAALTLVGSYVPVTIVFFAAGALLLGASPKLAGLVSIGITTILYGVFSGLLHIPLP